VFFLLFLFACDPGKQGAPTVEKKNVDLDKSKELKFSELFSKVKLIQLETNDSSLLGNEIKCRFHDEKLVFISNKSVYFFQSNGNFINKLFHFGKSPSEYLDVTDVFFTNSGDSELVNVYDEKSKQILSYDHTMNFISSINVNIKAYNVMFDKNQYFLYQGGFSDDNYMLKSLDQNGDIRKKFLKQKSYFKDYYYFMDYNNFFKFNDNLVFWNSPSTVVYNIKDNLLEPRYIFDFGKYTLPESFLERKFFDILEFDNALKNKNYAFPFFFNENNRTIVFHLRKGKSYYFYLYDKRKNKDFIANGFYDDMCFNTKLKFSAIESLPKIYIDDKMIFLIESYKVKELLEHSNANPNLNIKDIDINDNPLLLIGYLK